MHRLNKIKSTVVVAAVVVYNFVGSLILKDPFFQIIQKLQSLMNFIPCVV